MCRWGHCSNEVTQPLVRELEWNPAFCSRAGVLLPVGGGGGAQEGRWRNSEGLRGGGAEQGFDRWVGFESVTTA